MLSVGIIVDSPRVPAWITKVVREVQTSPEFRLTLVARVARPGRRRTAGLGEGTGHRPWSTAAFRLYQWLDSQVSRARNDAFARVDLRKCCGPLPLARRAIPAAGFESQWPEALEALAAADLDCLLDLSSFPLPRAVARCARFGVWSFHDGDPREYTHLPPLFAEMYDGVPIASAVVQCRTGAEDAARVLCRGTFILDRKSFHLSRNRSASSGVAYLLRRLRELACRGWQHLQSAPTWQEEDRYSKQADPLPSNATTLRFVARMTRRRLDRWSERFLFRQPWLIAYRAEGMAGDGGRSRRGEEEKGRRGEEDGRSLLSLSPPLPFSLSPGPSLRFLLPPADRFYADPCPFEHEGRRFVFFEDSRHKPVKGVISYVEFDPSGRAGEVKRALQLDCHLSYPFLFEWEGRSYMIPETFQHRRIELYRAEEFPDRWVLDRVLVDNTSGVDATLASFDGLWWLFVSQASPCGAFGHELSLYYADTPLGPWIPHPGNPVVTDVRQARPAGRPFQLGNRLIRPGQDCSARWGYAVSLNRIEFLSRTEYRERAVARLRPDWFPGAVATHTYNRSRSVEVFDVQVPVRRKANLLTACNDYAQLCNLCRCEEFRSAVDRGLSERMREIARQLAQ